MLHFLSRAIENGHYNVSIDFEFFGGSMNITTEIDNVRYDGNSIFIENGLADETEFDFEIKLDSTVKVDEKEFEDGFHILISYKGITGLVKNQHIYITVTED